MTHEAHTSRKRPKQLFEYEILGRLGVGAGSVIYLASDPTTSQVYALKHVVRDESGPPRIFEQLYNEYKVCGQLSHPVLRKCLTVRDKRTLLFKVTEAALVMELVDGLSMETHPPRDMRVIIDCFIQVAEGLAAMHAAGLVHCDLKPSNILRTQDGQIKIIDFGQACPVNTIKPRIQGTPDYIAPEQVRLEPVTARTDVFNFGATLYRVLTGRVVPTLFNTGKKTNSFVAVDMVAAPSSVRPDVPAALSSMAMECIRSQAHTRPAGMPDLIYHLQLIRHALGKGREVLHTDVPLHMDVPPHVARADQAAAESLSQQPPAGA
jgi:eukaryotic-like serine/threonine-protein kinase